MKRNTFYLLFLGFLLLSVNIAQSQTTISTQSSWMPDGAHSKVGFVITHLMISEVEGHFCGFDITATADDAFSEPSFIVELKAGSIDTDNDRRNEHLRSADFFDAETHPTIT